MREYEFLMTRILSYTGEYGQWKAVFSHILWSVLLIRNSTFNELLP